MSNMDYIKISSMRYCMHAGGMIMGEMLTNTVQAYRYWQERGEREFEFDVCRTDDGEYVTTHDLNNTFFQKNGIEELPDKLTEDWFISRDLYFNGKGPFHAMSVKDVLEDLAQNKIERIMLDSKDFSYEGTLLFLDFLRSQLDSYDINSQRIIVELYNPDMIAASRQYPFLVTYQYCVDDDIQQGNSIESRKLSNEELISYLNENHISIVSYPWKQAVENLSLLKMLSDNNFVIYSRTRNNIFQELLEQARVSVNIVDKILTEEETLSLQTYKSQYMAQYQERICHYFK